MATVADNLKDSADRHTVYLLRWSRGTYRRHSKLIDDMFADVATKLAMRAPDDDSFTAKRLQAMLAYTEERSDQLYKALESAIDGDYKELAEYEAEFQLNAIQMAYPIKLKLNPITPAKIHSAAMSRPFQGRILRDWWRNQNYQTKQRVASALRLGFVEDETISQVARRIGTIDDMTRRDVETIIRTATNHLSQTARNQVTSANEELFKYEEWSATLDGRTSAICRARDGQRYEIGKGPYPPAHFGCVLPSSSVSPSGAISYITKRPFNGDVAIIRTSGGNEISVTLNHPIMTDSGFVPAEFINIGDNLVSGLVGEMSPTECNDNKMKSSIENSFNSLLASGEMISCPMPHTSKDFHNDVIDDEIGVILIDRELADAMLPSLAHQFVKGFFAFRGSCGLINEPRYCEFPEFVVSLFSAESCGVSGFSECFNLIGARIIHSGLLLLRSISGFDSISDETVLYYAGRNTKAITDAATSNAFAEQFYDSSGIDGFMEAFGLSGKASSFDVPMNSGVAEPSYAGDFSKISPFIKEFDKVVDVNIRKFSGHVYNLECENGVFSTDNIITHNCRSARIPITKSWKELGFDELDDDKPLNTRPFVADKRPVKTIPKDVRSDVIGTTAAKSYNEWLKTQPREFVEDVLGKDKAKLYLDGDLPLDKFVDRQGTELTLDELRAKESKVYNEAWEKAFG